MGATRSIQFAAVLAALAVAAGAFGAHAPDGVLSHPRGAEYWQLAVRYQMWHALGALGLGILSRFGVNARPVLICFGVGVLLFCGSLYAIALGGPRVLGAVTPFGGSALILGWVLLIRQARAARVDPAS